MGTLNTPDPTAEKDWWDDRYWELERGNWSVSLKVGGTDADSDPGCGCRPDASPPERTFDIKRSEETPNIKLLLMPERDRPMDPMTELTEALLRIRSALHLLAGETETGTAQVTKTLESLSRKQLIATLGMTLVTLRKIIQRDAGTKANSESNKIDRIVDQMRGLVDQAGR